MAKIDIEIEIDRILSEYSKNVQTKLEDAADEVTKEGVQKLKSASLAKGWKDYGKRWKAERRGTTRIIANSRGQLTHLLEKGHALHQGGRARAFPHIKPVEEEIKKNFEKKVREIIQQ